MNRLLAILVAIALLVRPAIGDQARPATTDAELRYWIANMGAHNYSLAEMADVLGVDTNRIYAERAKPAFQPIQGTPGKVFVLPYPGGRHPRIGFLDGAVDPQRETKFSAFTPWDSNSYVVVDVPEAIFSNLGLTYLAHTHVPTIWTEKKVTLPPLEWKRNADGSLESERVLPNQIAFGVKVRPAFSNAVLMELWLRNGTDKPLTGMRVQNCVMLKAVNGFNQQTNVNKILTKPFAVCGSSDQKRWIITAWEPCHRTWANPPVPCMHSDPQIPDCPPGETKTVRGWLSFYEGTNVTNELKRIEALPWRDAAR